MKRQIKRFVVVSCLMILARTACAGLGIGDAMCDADVKLKSPDGSMLSIGDIKGAKGTLVVFTCNNCPFVKGWQDTMVELGNAYQEKGFGVVFINSNDPSAKGDTLAAMKELAETKGYAFPYVMDTTSDVARHFGATKTPDVFLFDAAGKLVYQGAVGEGGQTPKSGGEPYLKNALDALLEGGSVKVSQTKAVGCGIKFR